MPSNNPTTRLNEEIAQLSKLEFAYSKRTKSSNEDIKSIISKDYDNNVFGKKAISPKIHQDYVTVFVDNHPDRVLLIAKNRPSFQSGKWNLPGGKIERGEDPQDTAIRVLKEETGLTAIADQMMLMGTILVSGGSIYCYRTPIEDGELVPREQETEKPFWTYWWEARDDARLMPNLRIIIPLMRMGVKDWSIHTDSKNNGNQYHSAIVTVPSFENDNLTSELE